MYLKIIFFQRVQEGSNLVTRTAALQSGGVGWCGGGGAGGVWSQPELPVTGELLGGSSPVDGDRFPAWELVTDVESRRSDDRSADRKLLEVWRYSKDGGGPGFWKVLRETSPQNWFLYLRCSAMHCTVVHTTLIDFTDVCTAVVYSVPSRLPTLRQCAIFLENISCTNVKKHEL